jgi:hypothetical protein
VSAARRPSHLLLLRKALRDKLIDRRFGPIVVAVLGSVIKIKCLLGLGVRKIPNLEATPSSLNRLRYTAERYTQDSPKTRRRSHGV